MPAEAPAVADAVNTAASEPRTAEPVVSQCGEEEAWLAGWYAIAAEDSFRGARGHACADWHRRGPSDCGGGRGRARGRGRRRAP
eukprot:10507537-Lingulodinium_polyedra.AAC.1